MSDDDRFMEALIGYGVWQAAASARQQAEYQRQQLNLLRRHQGLPPIPPDAPTHMVADTLRVMALAVAVMAGAAAGIGLSELGAGGLVCWINGIYAAWWLARAAAALHQRWVRRSDAAFYDAWRRAGCP